MVYSPALQRKETLLNMPQAKVTVDKTKKSEEKVEVQAETKPSEVKPSKESKSSQDKKTSKSSKVSEPSKESESPQENKSTTDSKPVKESKPSAAPQSMEELLSGSAYQLIVPKKGESVTGLITAKNRKMLMVDIGAKTEGIVVDKEFEMASEYIDALEEGQEIEALVISEENNQGQVLLSLKKAASDARWDYFQEAIDQDTVLEAKGLEVNKGGLIVLVNGTRGFVPSSQFGKELVGSYQKLKGQTIQVKAIEVDREKNRLIFSERHVSEAQEIAQKSQALDSVQIGEIYEGVVSGVMHFGLFVTVEVPIEGSESQGHVEGLVHISEISWEKVAHPKEYHAVGDRVKVRVLGVDDRTGKLNLSIKQLSDDPWTSIDERYQPGTTLNGTVSRVEPFGVFVNVEAGVDGLIHSSKLESGQVMNRGDEVTVHVESVDPHQRRMSLSLVLTEVPIGYK
jgi:small subunit ribosomal protein S1